MANWLDMLKGIGGQQSPAISPWLQALQQYSGNTSKAVGSFLQQEGQPEPDSQAQTQMISPWLQALQQHKGNPLAAVGSFLQQMRQPTPQPTPQPVSQPITTQGQPMGMLGSPSWGGAPAATSPLMSILPRLQGGPSFSAPVDDGETYESIKAKRGVQAAKQWERARGGF